MSWCGRFWSSGLAIVLSCVSSLGAESSAGSDAVVPGKPAPNPVVERAMEVLRDECVACHRAGKAKGGLKLHSAEGLKAGGEAGPVITTGKASESLLVQVLDVKGDPHMPPKRQLSTEQVEALKRWVDMGAGWDASVMERPPKVAPVVVGVMPEGVRPTLALAFSPDGKWLARSRGGVVELRRAGEPGMPLHAEVNVFPEAVGSLVWTKEGDGLVVGGFRRVKVIDVAGAKVGGEVKGAFVGEIGAMVSDVAGGRLWVADSIAGRSGFVRQFTVGEFAEVAVWKAHEDSVLGLALSGDGKWLATAGADRVMKRWGAEDHGLAGVYEGHTNQVLSVVFEPTGTRIATAGADREVKVWDRETREQDAVLGDKRQVFTALAWGKDGVSLVGVTDRGAGSAFSEIKKHTGEQRSDTGKVKVLEKVTSALQSVAISPDGATAAAGGEDGRLHVWTLKDGKPVELKE